jgi:hypothetical protein
MAQRLTEKTITLPFSIDSYGKINVTTDPKKIWNDRIISAINTNLGERVMYPAFGTTIGLTILDTRDSLSSTIETEINRIFSLYFRLLRLNSVDVTYSADGSTINVNVTYTLPNESTSSLIVGLSTVDNSGIISEKRY